MDNEKLVIKLQETTDRSFRNEGRIKKLEEEHQALHQLATSVAVMAEQLKTMNDNVNELTEKVDTLEAKPAKRWDSMVEKIFITIAGALIGFILAQIGIM